MCNFNAICYNCKRCCRCARNSHRGRNLYKCNAQQLNHLAYRPNHTMIKPVSLPNTASSCPPSTDYGRSTSRSSKALSQNGTTLTRISAANGSVSPSRIVSTVTEPPLVECQTSFTKGSTLTTNSKKHPRSSNSKGTQRSEAMGYILATNQKPLNYIAEQADTNSLVERLISQVFPSCPQRCSVSACTCFCPQVTAPQQDTRNKSAMNISRAEIKPNERKQRSFSYLRSAKLKQEPSKAEPVLEMVKAKSKAKKKVKKKVAVSPAIPEAEEGKDFWFECNVPMRVSIPTSICLGAPWDNLASLPQSLPTDNNKLMALPAPGNNNSKALVKSDRNLLPPKASATLPQIPRNLCISVLPMGYRPSVPPPCEQIEEPPPVEPKLPKKKKKKLHAKKKAKTIDTPQKASLCSCCSISHKDQLEDFCKWINRETGEYATRKESQNCSLPNGMEKYERCQCRRTKNREQALESRNQDKAKLQEKRSHGGLNKNREQSKEMRKTIDEERSKICNDSTSKNRESIDGKPNADYNSRSGFYSLSEDMTSLKRCPCMIIQSQEQSIDAENQDARTGCHNYALSKDMLSAQRGPSNLDKSILSHKLKKRSSSNESLIKPNQALNVDQRKYSVEAKTLPESMDSRRNATAESRMPHRSSQRSYSCDSNNARLKFDSVTPNRSNSVGKESPEKKNYNEWLTKDPSIGSDEAESNVNRNAGGRNKTEVDWNNLMKFMKMFSPQSTAAPKCLVDKSTYVRTIDKCKIKCKHQNYNVCTEPKDCQRNSVESGTLEELMAALPHHSNSRLIELLKREKKKIRKQSRSSDAKKDGKPQVKIENKSESLSSKYPHKASHKSSLSIAKDFKLCIFRQDCNDSPPVLEEYKVAACSAYSSQENARNREGKCRNMKNADSFWCNLKRFCRKNCITCRDMLQKPVVLVPFRPGSDHNGKMMGMCKPDEWKELKIPRKSSSKHRNNQCPDDCAKSLPSLSVNPSGRALNGGQPKVKIGRKYSKGPCIATSTLQHRSNQSRCCNCQVESMLYEYLRNNCQSSRSQSAKSKSFPTDTKKSSQASPKQRHSTPSEASPRPFPPETEARESELNEAKRRQSHNRIQSQQSESLPSFRKTVDPSRSASPKYPVFQAQSFVKDHSQVASEAKDAPNRSESPSTSGFRADIRPLCSRIQLERSNQRHQTEVACDDIVLHLKPRPMRCTSKDLRHQDEVSENDISQIARGASSRQKQMRDLDEIVQSQDSVQCCNCSLNMSSEFQNQKELQLQKVMQEANYAYDRRHGQQFIECARSQHGETRREEAERICCCGYSQQQQQRQQRQQQIEQQQQQQRLHQQQLQHQQQQQQQQRQQQQQMQHQQQQRQQRQPQEQQQLYRQQQQIRQEDECTSYCRCPLSYQQQQMIPEQQQHVQLNNIQQHQYMQQQQQQHQQFEEDANYWPNTQQQRSQMLHHHDNNMQNDELFNCSNCLIAPSQQQLQCLPGFYSHIAPAPDLRSVHSSFYEQTLLKYGIQRLPDDYLQQLPPEAVCCASASCSCCTCCPYAYGQQQQQQPHQQ